MPSISFRPSDDPALVGEWDELADRTAAGPFSRAGWFQSWSRAFGPPVDVAVMEDGAALVPVIRNGTALASPTNEHSPEFATVSGTDEARHLLFRLLLAERRKSYHFAKLGEPDAAALRSSVQGERVVDEVMQRSPYLDIEGDWPSYEMTLNASFRQGLRRKERRLRDAGEVAFEFLDGGEGLDERLRKGFAVEGSSWKSAAGTAIASDRRTLAFYTDIARWAADRGWLRLWWLNLDGAVIAFRFDLEVAGIYYHLKGGYDPALGRYSPGLLLQHASVRKAFESGLTRYEFLGADEGYKLKWAKTTHERRSIRVFGRGTRGTIEWLDRGVARPAVKRIISRVGRRG